MLSAKDMSQSDVDGLGVMAWASQFRNVPPRPPIHDMLRLALDSTSGRVGEPVSDINLAELKVSFHGSYVYEDRCIHNIWITILIAP